MNRKIILMVCLFMIMLLIPMASQATLIADMEQISPVPTTYTLVDDFYPFLYTGVGDVTAALQYVGLGGLPSDYIGFTPGNIAIMERGSYTFEQKVATAVAAGAVGALVFDTNVQNDAILGNLSNPTSIPALFLTRDVGLDLLSLLGSGEVVIHMVTYTSQPPFPSELPEPATAILVAAGLLGVGIARRRLRS